MKFSTETQQYIDDQVRNGKYPTPEAVIEAAIASMQEDVIGTLDDEIISAINEGEQQADRGEGIDLDSYRAASAWEALDDYFPSHYYASGRARP